MIPSDEVNTRNLHSFSTFEMMFLYGELALNEIRAREKEDIVDFSVEQVAVSDPEAMSFISPAVDLEPTTSFAKEIIQQTYPTISTSSVLSEAVEDAMEFMSPPVKRKRTPLESPLQRKFHRAYTETAAVIKQNLLKLPKENHQEYLLKTLTSSGCFELAGSLFTSNISKPRNISRTGDYTINLIWNFWKQQSTVSYARTSRPANTPVHTFESDPLLSRVDIAGESFMTHTTKRNQTRYEHSYMVQNDTDRAMYQNFLDQHTVTVGYTTFRKLKPFYIRHCRGYDIETCCCVYHVNFRNSFEALSSLFKDCNFDCSEMVDKVTGIIESYSKFKSHLLVFCLRDEYSVLCIDCESGTCGHWAKQYDQLVAMICQLALEKKVTKKLPSQDLTTRIRKNTEQS